MILGSNTKHAPAYNKNHLWTIMMCGVRRYLCALVLK